MAILAVISLFLLIAGAFALYLVKRDQGESEPIGALWGAFGFGVLAVPLAMLLEWPLPDVQDFADGGISVVALVVAMLGVGVIEELAKSALLIRFIYPKRYFNEHTDGVIYFALAGLGFGLPENILYTMQFGAGIGLSRVVMTPLFHSATAAIIGYSLTRVKLDGKPKRTVVHMILAMILIHGVYDLGLTSGNVLLAYLSVMLTFALGIGVLLLILHARNLDRQMGLSVVGNNSFCRSCGHPNPKRKLYCSHCGKRA